MKEWWERCGQKILVAGAVCGALTAIFIFLAQLEPYRFWATAAEVQTLADRLYPITISEQRRVIAKIQLDLERALAVPVMERTPQQAQMILDLRVELQKANEGLAEMLTERAQFRARPRSQ